MRQSKLFTKIQKTAPKDEKSVNAVLLQRAGFIYKEMAGVYSFLPLGLRVLNKIVDIVRDEMNKIGGQEISMSVLQPKELWQKTGRWNEGIGEEVMYKCEKETVGLGPTHEEMLTDIVKRYIQNENDLPLSIYQIQTKFRKEPRAKSGLLRGREFLMKDLYSLHSSEESFKEYYEKVRQAYLSIFNRCGLKAIITEASGGGFSRACSHEFQVLSEAGEDEIIFCGQGHFSQNKEIAKLNQGGKCPKCGRELKKAKSIEAGNIFTLGDKYSKVLGAFFTNQKGEKKPVLMGCYGIGISRLMGAMVEVFHDNKGIIWPSAVAPFQVHLLALSASKGGASQSVIKAADKVFRDLQNSQIEVLYDDRGSKTAGEKFAEADLIGCPYRLVISEKTLLENKVEVKPRDKNEAELIDANTLSDFLFKN